MSITFCALFVLLFVIYVIKVFINLDTVLDDKKNHSKGSSYSAGRPLKYDTREKILSKIFIPFYDFREHMSNVK